LTATSRRTQILFLVVFLLSAGLRLGLVSYNRQSNDDHITVIQLILKTSSLPIKTDCWECFQPKLFHYSMAKFLQLSGLENAGQDTLVLAVELVNCAAGLLTILVIGLFVLRWPGKSEFLKVLAFGLVALNPNLTGINSQATNDTFMILFSTLALFCTYAFLQKQKPGTFLLILIFTILGISTKTNGWVTAGAIFLAFLVKAGLEKRLRIRMLLTTVLFGFVTLLVSIINPLNQYISNYRLYGSPLQLNITRQPLPHFFIQSSNPSFRPGILSIQDGLFTFKFIDLLRNPLIMNKDDYSPNRTSLWTQLYGRAHSVHFDNWPTSWSADGDRAFNLARAIYILALLPTACLLIGAIMEIVLALQAILKRDAGLASNVHFGLTIITFAGFVLFLILYAVEYRDFSVFKPIFIYPAILTFPILFLRAGEAIWSRLAGRLLWIRAAAGAWIVALCILYSADIITLTMLIALRMHGA